jgi:16S rRNA (cytosine967-C5)-methyltransferase
MTQDRERPPDIDRLLADVDNSRAVAAGLVAQWLVTADFPDWIIQDVRRDRPFIMEVLYGVVRRRRTLEWLVRPRVRSTPTPALRACLWVGVYQLLFMDTVAPHAAVHETVEAAKRAGGPRAAGFVNSILRAIAADIPALRAKLAEAPLGIRESVPDVILKRWLRAFGPPRTEALCRWQNERPAVCIHLRRDRTTMAAYLALLAERGLAATPHPFMADQFIQLPSGASVTELPGYAEGWFSVQDPATSVAVDLLDPQPGERILDACAAPGGKSMLIAERLAGTGTLIAMDTHADRLPDLRANAARLQAPMTVVQGDARQGRLDPAVDSAPFDRILADVPCTNTGVLRRRPDARWRFSIERLRELMRIQRRILDRLAPRLVPGGTLVYSTCSLEPEENDHIVTSWLSRNPDYEHIRSVQLFPPQSETDGAFAAIIRRKLVPTPPPAPAAPDDSTPPVDPDPNANLVPWPYPEKPAADPA